MLLKNVMWNIFQDTGRIDAYLFYCSCNADDDSVEIENIEIENKDNEAQRTESLAKKFNQ